MIVTETRYRHAAECGERIRAVREKHGWSTTELGKRSGFSQPQISAVELGKVNTPIETLARIAEALGVTLEYLIKGDELPDTTFMAVGKLLAWSQSRRSAYAMTLRALADEVDALAVPS